MSTPEHHPTFDPQTWEQLPNFLAHLPAPVQLVVWGDEKLGGQEKEAADLCRLLADRFETLSFRLLPRRINYDYYPVIGVMGHHGEGAEWTDFGVRIIGLPAGYQMTSLITAVQAVAFRGMTLEATTRIRLSKLDKEVRLEMLTSADNERGAIMAQILFNLAVVAPYVRSFLIMCDQFPEATLRYSVNRVPHTVINGRVHVEGVVDETTILKHIARAVRG